MGGILGRDIVPYDYKISYFCKIINIYYNNIILF